MWMSATHAWRHKIFLRHEGGFRATPSVAVATPLTYLADAAVPASASLRLCRLPRGSRQLTSQGLESLIGCCIRVGSMHHGHWARVAVLVLRCVSSEHTSWCCLGMFYHPTVLGWCTYGLLTGQCYVSQVMLVHAWDILYAYACVHGSGGSCSVRQPLWG
jgi:hypothetical protein